MANELVSQVMKDLARRAGVRPASPYSAREDPEFSALSPREDDFLRRLANEGRSFSAEKGDASAGRRFPKARKAELPARNAREAALAEISRKRDTEERHSRPSPRSRFSAKRNSIGLDDLAERSQGKARR